jgi:hypothetical protein
VRTRVVLGVALALCPAPAAQNQRVSPGFYATFEGNAATGYPFSAASFRYQQIHDDLRGAPLTITALAFRRDGTAAAPTLGVPRTVELDLVMAGSDARAAVPAFAANHGTPPAAVYLRKIVNLPDRTPPPASRPMPVDVVLPLDTAYPHDGQRDLLWEARVWANSAFPDQHYLSDAARDEDPSAAAHGALGQGCNTDRQNPLQIMRLSGAAYLDRAATLRLWWTCVDAPFSSPAAVVLLGTSNPDLMVPGLCGTRLRTDAAVALPPLRPVSAIGGFRTADAVVPWSQALARARVYAQAIAADPTQTPLPVAASNGVETDLPPGLPPALALCHVFAASPTAAAGIGVFGGGAVVRFTH